MNNISLDPLQFDRNHLPKQFTKYNLKAPAFLKPQIKISNKFDDREEFVFHFILELSRVLSG